MTRSTLKTLRNHLPGFAELAAFVTFTVLVAAGCSSTTRADVAPLAGRYELRSVDGRALPDDRLGGAIAGELVLSADGRATRTVQYATSGVPGPIVRRAEGTYRRHGGEVTLFLVRPGRAAPEARWELRGEVRQGRIALRYPGPAARIVEEEYVRVGGTG